MIPEQEYDPNMGPNTPADSDPLPSDDPTADPGLDALYDQGVDMDAVEKSESDSLLPNGGYQTIPVLAVTPYQTRSGPNKGRIGFRLYGEVVSRKPLVRVDGEAPQIVTGRLGFRVSPERRNREDGTPDTQFKLWTNSVRAFIVAAGYKPQTNREVIEYLRNYPVGLRVGQVGVPTERNPEPDGEPGNAVFTIFPLRES